MVNAIDAFNLYGKRFCGFEHILPFLFFIVTCQLLLLSIDRSRQGYFSNDNEKETIPFREIHTHLHIEMVQNENDVR